MPLVGTGVKLLSVPPVTVTSAWLKVVLASDSVKVIVSLLVSVPLPMRAIAIVGAVVSALLLPWLVMKFTVLLASAPSALGFSAASRKALLATYTLPVPWAPAVGVKVALYCVGLTCTQLLSVPPLTCTSPWTKSLEISESTKLSCAVWPATRVALSAVIAIVGAVVSGVAGLVPVL